jgi:hypothetical protein
VTGEGERKFEVSLPLDSSTTAERGFSTNDKHHIRAIERPSYVPPSFISDKRFEPAL